jgi:hypothetical protein
MDSHRQSDNAPFVRADNNAGVQSKVTMQPLDVSRIESDLIKALLALEHLV